MESSPDRERARKQRAAVSCTARSLVSRGTAGSVINIGMQMSAADPGASALPLPRRLVFTRRFLFRARPAS